MEKLKFVVLGLGNFGHSWASDVFPYVMDIAELAGVVDSNKKTYVGISENIQKFTNIKEALNQVKPDAVINVTPPDLHSEINRELLSLNIAVLCEKPISDSLEDAKRMLAFSKSNKTLFMISENYRYKTVFRRCREWITSDKIGEIHTLKCHFAHYHPDYSMYYHGKLQHPLLTDVTVHHLDLARFLSGQEAKDIYCKEWNASYSWYQNRPANAIIWTNMSGGATFQYSGTLAAPVSTTDWHGVWEIGGDKGIIRLQGEKLTCSIKEDEPEEVLVVPSEYKDTRVSVLKEFVQAYRENRLGETNIEDNFLTFLWLEGAVASSLQGKAIDINQI